MKQNEIKAARAKTKMSQEQLAKKEIIQNRIDYLKEIQIELLDAAMNMIYNSPYQLYTLELARKIALKKSQYRKELLLLKNN